MNTELKLAKLFELGIKLKDDFVKTVSPTLTLDNAAPKGDGAVAKNIAGDSSVFTAGNLEPSATTKCEYTPIAPGKYEFKINPKSKDYTTPTALDLVDSVGATSLGLYSVTKPSCPVALMGVWTKATKKVKVTWNAPADSGGAPVKNYVVM